MSSEQRYHLACEKLEGRALPATGIFYNAATQVVEVQGGAYSDTCYVTNGSSPGQIKITLDSRVGKTLLSATEKTLLQASVRQIQFFGYGSGDRFSNATTVADSARGGEGNDVLQGGLITSTLIGGPGDDSLSIYRGSLSTGRFELRGGEGNDNLYGGSGQNLLDGGAGADVLYGGLSSDTLLGGNGRDYLDGGTGADLLDGGPGNDSLFGGYDYRVPGRDTLIGGLGYDYFRVYCQLRDEGNFFDDILRDRGIEDEVSVTYYY